MANLNLLVVESSGKQKRKPSNAETVDFLSIKVGASGLEIKETSGHLDFGAKKLVNIANGGAAGEALSFSQRGAALGVASLDAGGKVPVSQLPSAIMEYQGVYNATTNSPALADFANGAAAGDSVGDVYRVGTAGSQDFGSGSISLEVGDYVILNALGKWEKSDTTDAVASVNGFIGVVVLTTSNIAEGSNLYFTDERAQDAVGATLTDTASIDLVYDDALNQISAIVLPAGVDHDALANFVANEHIDHSSVSILTGANSGLSGGGDLTASRSPVVAPANAPAASAALLDEMLISDVSDSGALKKITVQSILNLAGAGAAKSFINDNAGTITVGQIVYIKANGNMDLARATVAAIADGQLAVVKAASILTTDPGEVFVKDGEIISGFTGLTPGQKLYVSRATAGAMTQSLTGFLAGEMVYAIGRAISATEIVFDPEFEFEF